MENEPDKFLTTIPFSGFYETLHSDRLTSGIESLADCVTDEEIKAVFPGGLMDVLDKLDYSKMMLDYAKEYVNWFNSRYDLNLEFESLDSPKFYNYETDRIFCLADKSTIRGIIRRTAESVLRELVKESLIPRSGFIPFYSNDLDEWGPAESWDYNQMGILMEAFCHTQDNVPVSQYLSIDMESYGDIEIDSIAYLPYSVADKFLDLIDRNWR